MGVVGHDGLAVPGRVVLAHEAPFIVGVVKVDPATRQIRNGRRRATLEPRVMQVLVALFRANGGFVTRDELIEGCWNGRIVSEDAINRAISRLRKIAGGIGDDTFLIETVAKVGYRLEARQLRSAEGDKSVELSIMSSPDRRTALAAMALAAAVAGGGLLWLKPWRHHPPEQAIDLVRRGDLAQRAGFADQARQSVTFFEQAVRIDPRYGEAWGMLALAYTHNLEGYGEAELESLPQRIRSAAANALSLDPGNPDAELALACIAPNFRNWLPMERRLRDIHRQHPEHWLANGRLAVLLYQVGRLQEGAALHRGVISREPMIPGPYAMAATALSSAGRMQDADAIFDAARSKWPAHPMLWFARFDHLLFSGRAASAAAFAMDPDSRPSGLGTAAVEPFLLLARAMETRNADDVGTAIRSERELALNDVRYTPRAARIFAAFGANDLLFDCLNRYYFDEGTFGGSTPIGPYSRRHTDFLWSLPMADARQDSRFATITRRVGLQAYWRAAGISRA